MVDGVGPSPAIEIRGARLTYGATEVFHDLDIDLDGGVWTGLIGRSGVGKTSLLRLVAGLADGATGEVTMRGRDGARASERLAYMAQQDLLMPWLTVLDNVILGVRLRGGDRFDSNTLARGRHLLAAVGLEDKAEALPAALSGGMRQRAALARTLMEDRPVVLMDEPFSSLDAITRYRLQDLAAELLTGRTVLLVTHDPLEALRLCQVVHVLAGAPAAVQSTIAPEGDPPRDITDRRLLALHGELLTGLAAERRAA